MFLPKKRVIFHSYVKFPEGIYFFHLGAQSLTLGHESPPPKASTKTPKTPLGSSPRWWVLVHRKQLVGGFGLNDVYSMRLGFDVFFCVEMGKL